MLSFRRKHLFASAQTAIEYLLLLAVVAVFFFVGMRYFLPRAQTSSNAMYQKMAIGIMGEPPPSPDFSP